MTRTDIKAAAKTLSADIGFSCSAISAMLLQVISNSSRGGLISAVDALATSRRDLTTDQTSQLAGFLISAGTVMMAA